MTHRQRLRGATTVEFALVLMIFLTFLLGIVDFSRLLWTWNAANEATRWGARVSVVCDKGAAAVLKRMQVFVPQLMTDNVRVNWYDVDGNVSTSCNASNCAGVEVRIVNLQYQWISPLGFSNYTGFKPFSGFSTYLPREVMGQDPGSSSICS